jgi:hypothetical protein
MTHSYGLPGRAGAGKFVAKLLRHFLGLTAKLAVAMGAAVALAAPAFAETLLMPTRDARQGVPVVVWGVHTQAAGTVCALDFGDLTGIQNCTGVDRSYIAYPHTYASQGTYTVRLTVGLETTTTTIQIFNPALLTADNNRSLGINMAIQDGLRFLWTSQDNRAASFPATVTSSWNNSGFPYGDTSLVVLAFENQGYKITANVAPTGIYEKYIVRRGLNYVISQLSTLALGVTPGGNNPCVIYADCVGLQPPGDQGYTTALAILGFAGSGALTQVSTEVAGYTNGKTYGEIMQRLVNALAWGQNDSGTGQGGWYYTFNSSTADGSTLGWDILALLDATASGATVPPWVITQFKIGFDRALNTNGSFDYQADANPAALNNVGPQKNGIGLQGLFLISEMSGVRFDAVVNNVNSWWGGAGGIGGNVWGTCGPVANAAGKGCAYTMFNNFKGLKLMGINTLPGVTRPAGPGAQPAGDWYADYQDWFVANQSNPTTTAGGSWNGMTFSCCANGLSINAAIAELILAPVALVAPDPVLFSTVGLSPTTATNPVGTSHTVTALTQAANNAPVPGVTITFRVMTGPNAGKNGSGTTGADGKTTFTYTDTAGPGIDTIQAFIGTTLSSNVVQKIWGLACDVNNDGIVNLADILLIRGRLNTVATSATDPFDPNRDGVVNVADMRYCQLRQTPVAR